MSIEDKIDLKQVLNCLSTLKISNYRNIVTDDTLIVKYVSIAQIIYNEENEYEVNNIYLYINDFTEIVIDKYYEFRCLNIFKDNVCYSYDKNSNLINKYAINSQTDDILITKSNGDIYYSNKIKIDDKNLDEIRKKWGKSLLCYSNKSDGRFCFYIRTRKDINYALPTSLFQQN